MALRYFVVQVFVMNWDSYLGYTGHNYFLYEEDGLLTILPWDYNLAFGTYALGMTNPIRDPNLLINYPIYTPAEGSVMLERPLYHQLMLQDEYFARYRAYFDAFLSDYVESGRLQAGLHQMAQQIAHMCKRIPRRFAPLPIISWRWIRWNRLACSGRQAPADSCKAKYQPHGVNKWNDQENG